MKILIFDCGNSLHTPSYCNAIKYSFLHRNDQFLVKTNLSNKFFSFYHLFRVLNHYKPDLFFIVTGDKFAKWYSFLWLFLTVFKRVPCVAFYFSYHNLYYYSPKSFILQVLLGIGFIDRLVVSDPLLESCVRNPLFSKSKIYFAPDYWEPQDCICNAFTKERSRDILGLDHSSYIVSLVGSVNEKKAFSLLMNICRHHSAAIEKNNVTFLIAGSFSFDARSLLHETFGSSDSLPHYISVRDTFIPDNLLPHYLNASNLVWCIQNDFMNSSGIFTRACANGIPSIVSPNSTLSSLSTMYNIGIVPPDLNSASVLDSIINFSKRNYSDQMSINCMNYASLTSLDSFSANLNRICSDLI